MIILRKINAACFVEKCDAAQWALQLRSRFADQNHDQARISKDAVCANVHIETGKSGHERNIVQQVGLLYRLHACFRATNGGHCSAIYEQVSISRSGNWHRIQCLLIHSDQIRSATQDSHSGDDAVGRPVRHHMLGVEHL